MNQNLTIQNKSKKYTIHQCTIEHIKAHSMPLKYRDIKPLIDLLMSMSGCSNRRS